MRHCCERIVASSQVGIARVFGQKASVSKLGGRTVVEDGLLKQRSKNTFKVYIRLMKCVGDNWKTKRPKALSNLGISLNTS